MRRSKTKPVPIKKRSVVKKPYKLMDGVKRNAQFPETFEIPNEKDKDKVVIGDYIKLGFECVDGTGGERMWVIYNGIRDKKMIGTLDNIPIIIPNLEHLDTVEFEKKHILDIKSNPLKSTLVN